jgi:hypothetical protein
MPVSRLTGNLGAGTHMSGLRVNRELGAWASPQSVVPYNSGSVNL